MKKYYMTISQQKEGGLNAALYINPGKNPVLESDTPTHYPIIPLIANTAEAGEKICIYAICPDHPNTRLNYELLKADLTAIKEKIGFEYELSVIESAFSEMVSDHLELFGKLVTTAGDDEIIYADITYGTKPIPMILMMFMTYAYKFKKNVSVENIIYGLYDHNTNTGRTFDVSALFYMNSTINSMDSDSDPIEMIKLLIDM